MLLMFSLCHFCCFLCYQWLLTAHSSSHSSTNQPAVWRGGSLGWHGQSPMLPHQVTSLGLSSVTTPWPQMMTSRRLMLAGRPTRSCCRVRRHKSLVHFKKKWKWGVFLCFMSGHSNCIVISPLSYRPAAQHWLPHQRCLSVWWTGKSTSHRDSEDKWVWQKGL